MVDIIVQRLTNDDYKNVHLKYILWHFEYMSIITIKKISLSLIEFFIGIIIFNQVNQARGDQRLRNKKAKILLSVDWLVTCNKIVIVVTN